MQGTLFYERSEIMINAKSKIEKRNIQNKLRLLRKGQGVTQEELAERIGCSRQALNMFEQGKTWSSEWEERYHIALGFERKEPGEIPSGALSDQGETLITPHDKEGDAGDPQETEKWNGIHAQITAPKGTFEQIFNEAESEDKE